MSSVMAMSAQLAANAARFGLFFGVNQLAEQRTRSLGQHRPYRPTRPVPDRQELMVTLASLFLSDAESVRQGLYPPMDTEPGLMAGQFNRLRAMLADLPGALARRAGAEADSARAEPGSNGLPDYYVQDFHFQSGGYLSPLSARLYDVQVETLFYGAANAMRRAALPAIAGELAGRDQRRVALLDVACGTGRFLRQVRRAWPALGLTGVDLSEAYLAEARRHMQGLRPARLIEANAEQLPLPDASQDIVTVIFLFHELPAEVRRRVTAEIARVLKPGGLFVFIDSLQMGDKPGWDGLLEGFPVRFHEPYFRHYAIDDLDAVFAEAGLAAQSQMLAFLAKVMVRNRA